MNSDVLSIIMNYFYLVSSYSEQILFASFSTFICTY